MLQIFLFEKGFWLSVRNFLGKNLFSFGWARQVCQINQFATTYVTVRNQDLLTNKKLVG